MGGCVLDLLRSGSCVLCGVDCELGVVCLAELGADLNGGADSYYSSDGDFVWGDLSSWPEGRRREAWEGVLTGGNNLHDLFGGGLRRWG